VTLQQAIQTEANAAYEYEKAVNRPWEWRFEEVQKAYTKAWQDAKDRLAAAQADLQTSTLTAPFDGTIVAIDLRPHDWAQPVVPAVTLALILSESVPVISSGGSVTATTGCGGTN
jgi:multidrug resistance efflux pump